MLSAKLCTPMDVFGPEKAKKKSKKSMEIRNCSMSQEISSPSGSPMRLIEFAGRGRPPTTHSPMQKDANFGGKDVPPAMPEVPPMNFGGRRESGTIEFKKWSKIHELDTCKSHALTRVQMFHPHTLLQQNGSVIYSKQRRTRSWKIYIPLTRLPCMWRRPCSA